jgi:hypothetical protein
MTHGVNETTHGWVILSLDRPADLPETKGLQSLVLLAARARC